MSSKSRNAFETSRDTMARERREAFDIPRDPIPTERRAAFEIPRTTTATLKRRRYDDGDKVAQSTNPKRARMTQQKTRQSAPDLRDIKRPREQLLTEPDLDFSDSPSSASSDGDSTGNNTLKAAIDILLGRALIGSRKAHKSSRANGSQRSARTSTGRASNRAHRISRSRTRTSHGEPASRQDLSLPPLPPIFKTVDYNAGASDDYADELIPPHITINVFEKGSNPNCFFLQEPPPCHIAHSR
ncbi:hypothetical protein F4677DRAFT_409273 [Hypoxylon crocopeplum]|nr:hypothetical protein F4677DRAFT_409273 [Hypoxylon crocopeplum]